MGLRTFLGLKEPLQVRQRRARRARRLTELSRTEPVTLTTKPDYWVRRADAIYLQYVFFIARVIGKDARSLVDVGSKNCAYLEWFDWMERKVSIDLLNPYSSPTVEGIKGDFFTTDVGGPYDLCLCLQVLEHIEDARSFAQKLLAIAPQTIISVPYKWRKGWVPFHPQDPVDEAKLRDWFGRDPNWSIVVTEPLTKQRRIVCWYDRDEPERRIPKEELWNRRPHAAILAQGPVCRKGAMEPSD